MSRGEQFSFIFQGGKLVDVEVTATAGNATKNLTAPTGKRWKIIRGLLTLTTDATVANRQFYIATTDGTNLTGYDISTGQNITASQTIPVSLQTRFRGTDGLFHFLQIRQNLYIEGSDQWQIKVNNGVAGDSYSGYITVLEIDIE